MFENLTGRLEATLKRLRGEARLTEANIAGTALLVVAYLGTKFVLEVVLGR